MIYISQNVFEKDEVCTWASQKRLIFATKNLPSEKNQGEAYNERKTRWQLHKIMDKSRSWQNLCLSNIENRTHTLMIHAWNRFDRAAGLAQVAQNIKQIPSKPNSPAPGWQQHFFQRNSHWPSYHQECDRSDHRKRVIKMITMLIVSD